MQTVLVIDMLEDFFGEPPLKDMRASLTRNINALVEQSRQRNIKIIWIRQAFSPDLSDAFLAMRKNSIRNTIEGTHGAKILEELEVLDSDIQIIKKRYSAFFETELDEVLRDLETSEIIIAGVNTHACIRTAAIDAYQRDYKVIIPEECVASYDAAHHDITLRYVERHIAEVVSLGDIWREGAE